MLTKQKPVKLASKAKEKLRQEILDRDKCCIYSGRTDNLEWHHEPCGNGKRSDEITKGVMLNRYIHWLRHNDGIEGIRIKQHCEWYLEARYCQQDDTDHCKECLNGLCEHAEAYKKESPEGLKSRHF